MASDVQNGTGILFGITNDGTPITMLGYATFVLEGADLGHKFDLDTVKDVGKFDASLIATNAHTEVEITWVPSGATRAAAATTAAALLPLAKVTLTHFKVSAFNGDYIYVGDLAIKLTQGVAKMSLKIRKYDDSTQNTSLTTTVTG
jgi:hypothetical protein